MKTYLERLNRPVLEVIPAGAQPDARKQKIVRLVAEFFDISEGQLLGRRRTKNLILARHAAVWFCTEHTHASSPELGRFFDRDHGSILAARKAWENQVETDPRFRDEMAALGRQIAFNMSGSWP